MNRKHTELSLRVSGIGLTLVSAFAPCLGLSASPTPSPSPSGSLTTGVRNLIDTIGSNGAGFTWDGRVYISMGGPTAAPSPSASPLSGSSMMANVFRLEAVNNQALQPLDYKSLPAGSPPPFQPYATPFLPATPGKNTQGVVSGCMLDSYVALSVAPLNGDFTNNPYPSNAAGEPVNPGSCSGSNGPCYETYLVNVIASRNFEAPTANCGQFVNESGSPNWGLDYICSESYLIQTIGKKTVTPQGTTYTAPEGTVTITPESTTTNSVQTGWQPWVAPTGTPNFSYVNPPGQTSATVQGGCGDSVYRGPVSSYIYQFPGYVVVENPKTTSAQVIAGGPGSPGKPLQNPIQEQVLVTVNGNIIHGIEPTLSMDGRFLLYNGLAISGPADTPVEVTDIDPYTGKPVVDPSTGQPYQSNLGGIFFSYNPIPGGTVAGGTSTGWSEPLPLEKAYTLANTLVPVYNSSGAKVVDASNNPLTQRFGDIFPIANKPLLRNNGEPYEPVTSADFSPKVIGAYPWINFDASDAFFQSGGRSGLTVIGAHTGYAQRHVDNWLDDDRGAAQHFFTISPGAFPGMWNPMKGMANPPLPIFSEKPQIIPLFSPETSQYAELSLANATDGNYALYLEMNELLDYPIPPQANLQTPPMTYFTNETPDSSGNSNTGTLVGEAEFPFEQFGGGKYQLCSNGMTAATCPWSPSPSNPNPTGPERRKDRTSINLNEDQSISGQSVYLGASGAVIVQDNPVSLRFSSTPGLSVEMWFRPMPQPSPEASQAPQAESLIQKQGTFSISLVSQGSQLQSSVYVGSSSNPILLSSGPITLGSTGWTHVALTYDPVAETLSTYLNGVLANTVSAQAPSPLPIVDSAFPIIIGPGTAPGALPNPVAWIPPAVWPPSDSTALPAPPASYVAPIEAPVLMVDEVKISNVVRTSNDIAISAFLKMKSPQPQSSAAPNLPLGLNASDLQIPPTETFSPDVIQLGQSLFFDTRLSGTQTVSCASCHNPANAFTDSRARTTGVTGVVLPRTPPSILNRAFSSMQMWDGAASSLETQALLPLYHVNEMGTNAGELSAFLNSVPAYQSVLQKHYGSVTPQTVGGIIGTVLASFERSLMSADSPFDQYLAAVSSPSSGTASNPESILGSNSASVINGMQLFLGKARCVACHSNSNFTDESFHRSILFETENYDNPQVSPSPSPSPELGREDVTLRPEDLGKFKTPSLRNLSLMTRYFHSGAVTDLATVVSLYNQGPVYDPAYPPDPELRPLGLSVSEQADLVAFLEALTSSDPMPSATPAAPAPISTSVPDQSVTVSTTRTYDRTCDLGALGQATPSVTNQVAYAYCLILGRPADILGLLGYSGQVAFARMTLLDLLQGFYQSTEFTGRFAPASLSDPDFVTFIYELLYLHAPNSNQLAQYTAALESGSSRFALFNFLVGSYYFSIQNPILAPAMGPPGSGPVTPVAGDSVDCFTQTPGINGVPALVNSDTRFLCSKGQWYDCGWNLNDPLWEIKAADRQQVGNLSCDLAQSRWVAPASLPPLTAPLTASAEITLSSSQSPVMRQCDLQALGQPSPFLVDQMAYIYCLMLARGADVPGLLAWDGQIAAGQMTVHQVLDRFYSSTEFTGRFSPATLSDSEFVSFLYQLLYLRLPNPNELSRYTTALSTGSSRQALFDFFVDSYYFAAQNPILAPLLGKPGSAPVTPVMGDTVDCFKQTPGINGIALLDNSDTRFLCSNGQWYDCGWNYSQPSWEIKATDGQKVGNFACDLAGSVWVVPTLLSP